MNYFSIHDVIELAAEFIDPYRAMAAAGLVFIAGVIIFINRRRKKSDSMDNVA